MKDFFFLFFWVDGGGGMDGWMDGWMDGKMRHNTMWEHNATNRGRAAVWAPELVRVV
jgi:hypothetical protein